MPRARRCRPLGLVELIVVIVIIGILAAIAVVGYQAVIDKTEVEAAKQELLQEGKQAAALAAFEQAPGGGSADPADHTTADDAPVVVNGRSLQLTWNGFTPVVTDTAVPAA